MLRKSPKYLPKNGLNAYGFTLIELMIVVAIIGVLASIAYPSYMGSVQKSKRTGAKVAVMEVAQAQERYFSVSMQYAYNLTTLQASSGANLGDADDYTITVAGKKSDSTVCASGEVCVTYTVTAVPKTISSQNNDNSCKKFTLTHTGIQAAEDSSAADTSSVCW